jgi:hypothetical protein
MMSARRILPVRVLGFNATETLLLAGMFELSMRRSLAYRSALPGETAALILVDGQARGCIAQARELLAGCPAPVVLLAPTDLGTGWPTLARPLHWARLFEMMDRVLLSAPVPAAPPDIPARPALPARSVRLMPSAMPAPALLRQVTHV